MGDYSGYVLIFALLLKALAVQVHCCSCHCPPKPYWFSPLFTDSNYLNSYLQQQPPHHFVPPPQPIFMTPQPESPPKEEPAKLEVKVIEMQSIPMPSIQMTTMPMPSIPMPSMPMSSMPMPSMPMPSMPVPVMSMPSMPMPSMEMYKVKEEVKEPPPAPVMFQSNEGMSETTEVMVEMEKSEPSVPNEDNQIMKIEQSPPPSMNDVKEYDEHLEKDGDHHHDKNTYYKFEYAVNDQKTHDIKSQKEERKGDVVKGEYSLLEADGNVRTVKYYADWKSGFHADVHNSKKPGR